MKIHAHNEVGLRKTKKGKLVYPFREQDGQWVPVDPPVGDAWAEVELPDPPSPPQPPTGPDTSREHAALVAKIRKKPEYQYTAHGVTVRLLSPVVHNEALNVVEVRVLALKEGTNELLDVADGVFQFWNPPAITEAAFLDFLAVAVARHNGMAD